jgi:Zn-dependent protease
MQYSSAFLMLFLTALNLGLIWLLLAIPLGVRTVTRTIKIKAAPERLWHALFPFGDHAGWNGTIISAEPEPGTKRYGTLRISYDDRNGDPIARKIRLDELTEGKSYTLRITDDTSLDPSFWQNYNETVDIVSDGGASLVIVSETDSYRGFAFLGFRYFKIRRQLLGLKIWGETGRYKSIGLFERPITQVWMAVISTLMIWPFFGLTTPGLALAASLTAVVALHEFGHMFAFRVMGHKSARMIFIPILGGIAMGGRPYDRHFEIGFSALMGAGFSVFPVAACIAVYPVALASGHNQLAAAVVSFGLIGSIFNLANLVPVWKFDGGQVIRQVFEGRLAQAIASFVILGALMLLGSYCGFSLGVLVPVAAVFVVLSLITSGTSFKPRHALKPMTGKERLLIMAGLAATFAAHSLGAVWGLSQFG